MWLFSQIRSHCQAKTFLSYLKDAGFSRTLRTNDSNLGQVEVDWILSGPCDQAWAEVDLFDEGLHALVGQRLGHFDEVCVYKLMERCFAHLRWLSTNLFRLHSDWIYNLDKTSLKVFFEAYFAMISPLLPCE